MQIPKKIEGLKTYELRTINAEINALNEKLAKGVLTPQNTIDRLHVIACRLPQIDEKLVGQSNA